MSIILCLVEAQLTVVYLKICSIFETKTKLCFLGDLRVGISCWSLPSVWSFLWPQELAYTDSEFTVGNSLP